jgi:uncharacterized coiled-coil protein SlyX
MKTIEERVTILEKTLKNLQDSFIQAQKNLSPTTAKVDDTANQVKALSPKHMETKDAYIGDTQIVFDNLPDGFFSVLGLRYPYKHTFFPSTSGKGCSVLIEWDIPLEEVTPITVMIT